MSQYLKIRNESHLGDNISLLLLTHSFSLSNKKIIKINGPNYINDLLKIFEMPYLIYENNSKQENFNMNLKSILPVEFEKYEMPWINANFFEATFKMKSKEISMPKIKSKPTKKENTLCFQFDSRSTKEFKKEITQEEIKKIICKSSKGFDAIYGIGGLDTKIYIEEEFRLGTIPHIVKNLMSCKKFLGCDSGMSHIAGICQKPGDIIVMYDNYKYYKQLKLVFKFLYPSLKLHFRNNLFF
jgi:hypothetical protein